MEFFHSGVGVGVSVAVASLECRNFSERHWHFVYLVKQRDSVMCFTVSNC